MAFFLYSVRILTAPGLSMEATIKERARPGLHYQAGQQSFVTKHSTHSCWWVLIRLLVFFYVSKFLYRFYFDLDSAFVLVVCIRNYKMHCHQQSFLQLKKKRPLHLREVVTYIVKPLTIYPISDNVRRSLIISALKGRFYVISADIKGAPKVRPNL